MNCYTGLDARCFTKEAMTASSVEHFKENQENTNNMRLLCSGNINGKEYYMVKQILHGTMSSYFYVDSIATMLTTSSDNGVTT